MFPNELEWNHSLTNVAMGGKKTRPVALATPEHTTPCENDKVKVVHRNIGKFSHQFKLSQTHNNDSVQVVREKEPTAGPPACPCIICCQRQTQTSHARQQHASTFSGSDEANLVCAHINCQQLAGFVKCAARTSTSRTTTRMCAEKAIRLWDSGW